MKKGILAITLVALFGTASAFADTVTRLDGTTLQGRIVETEAGYALHAEDGSVSYLSTKDVVCVEITPTVVETYYQKATAIEDCPCPDAHYELAEWAHENKLAEQARKQLEIVVSINPDHEAAQDALGNVKVNDLWMPVDDAMVARGFIKHNGQWMTEAEVAWVTRDQSVTKNDSLFSNEELERLDDKELRKQIRDLIRTLPENEQKDLLLNGITKDATGFRALCMEELGRFATEDVFDTLIRSALLDEKREVRLAAVDSLQRISNASNMSAEKEMCEAVSDERALVRFAAIDALAHIGGPSGVKTMVNQYRVTYSGGPRSFIAFMNQLSYIEDYDVQVATGATIADPVIGILQTGQVMDVQPLRITEYMQIVERKHIWGALNKVRNEPQPASLEDFNKWWDKERLKYEN